MGAQRGGVLGDGSGHCRGGCSDEDEREKGREVNGIQVSAKLPIRRRPNRDHLGTRFRGPACPLLDRDGSRCCLCGRLLLLSLHHPRIYPSLGLRRRRRQASSTTPWNAFLSENIRPQSSAKTYTYASAWINAKPARPLVMSVSCKLSFPPAPYPMSALAAPQTGFLQTRATSSFFWELPSRSHLELGPCQRQAVPPLDPLSLWLRISLVSTSGNNQSNRFCLLGRTYANVAVHIFAQPMTSHRNHAGLPGPDTISRSLSPCRASRRRVRCPSAPHRLTSFTSVEGSSQPS